MEDGACGEGYLIAACLALVEVTGTMKVCAVVMTPGAAVTLWPTQTEKVFLACFLGAKSSLKCNEAHWLLLHRDNSFHCDFNILYYILGVKAISDKSKVFLE
jgi:hypothetical protein